MVCECVHACRKCLLSRSSEHRLAGYVIKAPLSRTMRPRVVICARNQGNLDYGLEGLLDRCLLVWPAVMSRSVCGQVDRSTARHSGPRTVGAVSTQVALSGQITETPRPGRRDSGLVRGRTRRHTHCTYQLLLPLVKVQIEHTNERTPCTHVRTQIEKESG